VLLFLIAGCGAQYRPVVTPITPTGPASQPTAYFLALSSPSATEPGLATLVDAFGDTVLGQATLSDNPFAFALSSNGGTGYNLNGNETVAGNTAGQQNNFTLNSYPITAGSSSTSGLRTQIVSNSTINSQAFPFNGISTANAFYLLEPYTNPVTGVSTSLAAGKSAANQAYVGEFTGTPPALLQEIQVAPDPVNFAGTSGGPRLYVISQGSTTGGALANANACNTPSSVTTNGEVDSLEVTTNTISKEIPVGICPVYGIESADYLRAFILNRGSGTISVINAQSNAPDATTPTITVGAGPVFADLYSPSSLLVTANYDSNTISVINVPTDIYDNDAPIFGTVTTIPVGRGPVALTILRDGSRAYVANQIDGTVSVVNLTNFTVTKTITLPPNSSGQASQPRSIASVFSSPAGTVYVASPNSNTLTVINTETETVSASVLLPANAVSVYSTTQNVSSTSATNSIVNSNASGRGTPCAASDTSPFCPAPVD
jgi:YVTN family beta-propeller protein